MVRFTSVLPLGLLVLLSATLDVSNAGKNTKAVASLGNNATKQRLGVRPQGSTVQGQFPAWCPPGFTHLLSAASCYNVIYESHDWESAGKKCQGLSNGSHLAAVTSAAENSALKTFLATELSKSGANTACIAPGYTRMGALFWTSGQRLVGNDCTTPFVWKTWHDIRLPFNFTSWITRQPDCLVKEEMCVHIWATNNFDWNDAKCDVRFCPLCEFNP